MIKILFVCHGNICRSPMAEIFMKDDCAKCGVSGHFFIESAAVSTEEIYNGIGNPVYPPAKAELRRHGLSCEGKRARRMTREDYEKFDLLIGMDSSNISWMKQIAGGDSDGKMYRLLDFTDEKRDVADPWYTDDFETTWNDIVKGCTALREILTFHNHLVLASGSPRRKELLEQIGYQLTIDPSDAEENVDINKLKSEAARENNHSSQSQLNKQNCMYNFDNEQKYKYDFPALYVQKLSSIKAEDVAKRHPSDFILGADTVVALDDEILGKPKSEADAKKMLSMLSGRTHHVYTGVTILRTFEGQIIYRKTFSECTEVKFYDLTEREIDDYIATGEPMDKAGSYGIQGRGAVLVQGIHGDYNNVVGLPISAVNQILTK